ncbi:MAG: hypothetical protein JXN61_08360 [Sedimentisphaerales bacterium]|nr:hypothetical protein [Sedimentisphaerales bacterium]
MTTPVLDGNHLVVTNGKGRLFIETLLPANPVVRLASGDELYRYDGKSYPPERDTGPAPQCRIEISPSNPNHIDYFIYVLTATDSDTGSIAPTNFNASDAEVSVTVGQTVLTFQKAGTELSVGTR